MQTTISERFASGFLGCLAKFDPDQERDASGRFASGSGSGGKPVLEAEADKRLNLLGEARRLQSAAAGSLSSKKVTAQNALDAARHATRAAARVRDAAEGVQVSVVDAAKRLVAEGQRLVEDHARGVKTLAAHGQEPTETQASESDVEQLRLFMSRVGSVGQHTRNAVASKFGKSHTPPTRGSTHSPTQMVPVSTPPPVDVTVAAPVPAAGESPERTPAAQQGPTEAETRAAEQLHGLALRIEMGEVKGPALAAELQRIITSLKPASAGAGRGGQPAVAAAKPRA